MRNIKKWAAIVVLTFTLSSCDSLLQAIDAANKTVGSLEGITQSEAASGLKSALEIGVNNGTSFLGKRDGFLKNAAYKILMPPEVRNAEQKIRSNAIANAIAGPFLDKLVTAMNRGSENAMAKAKPIFVKAVRSMTIKDAINIVTGGNGAGTAYLKRVTTYELKSQFKPVIKTALDGVNINEPWTKVSKAYNLVMGKKVQTDLNEYVTDNAMKALFSRIKTEEDKIRSNPIARTTSILKKVFGYADSKKNG